eukprot:CAMPEP_0115881630 /NCGR_PEP_ID=MMETSP0287-20121206/28548_1 /TAXON_ID=412157 /ORGANISM="Chrysochromulina rotalis, Strain UIO044" /LENGTH=75 /DNA_ID=CAMNT_0003337603 /DNA_START=31 /DNA_END=258 /DNA_ORIENTATION=+
MAGIRAPPSSHRQHRTRAPCCCQPGARAMGRLSPLHAAAAQSALRTPRCEVGRYAGLSARLPSRSRSSPTHESYG